MTHHGMCLTVGRPLMLRYLVQLQLDNCQRLRPTELKSLTASVCCSPSISAPVNLSINTNHKFTWVRRWTLSTCGSVWDQPCLKVCAYVLCARYWPRAVISQTWKCKWQSCVCIAVGQIIRSKHMVCHPRFLHNSIYGAIEKDNITYSRTNNNIYKCGRTYFLDDKSYGMKSSIEVPWSKDRFCYQSYLVLIICCSLWSGNALLLAHI